MQVVYQIAQWHDGFARRWITVSEHRWRKPAFADCLGQQRIHKEGAATRLRRNNFRHYAIAVRDQYGFTAGGEPDKFAKLVSENFQAD